jgi:two-component system sensor histidine kinase TctE
MLGVLFLAGTVALLFAARAYGRLAADKSYDRLLAGSALSIAETLSVDRGKLQVDLPYAALDMLSAAPDDRVFYRVIGPDSKTVTGYDDLPGWKSPTRRERLATPDSTRFFDASYRGESVRFAVLGREIAAPETQGWVWVQVGHTRRARDELVKELVLGAVAPIGLLTLLALSVVMLGITQALRPLQRVGEDLAGRPPEDLQPILEPVPREIMPLIDAINGFMRRLSTSFEALRAFIGEAAHQMRTPLASLYAQAHVAADEDPEELRKSMVVIERNAARLSRLLDQLLSDATVTHRSDVRVFESCDLLEVVHEAISEGVPHSRRKDIAVRTELDRAPFVGDALMLGEAMKNLIDNALKYGSVPGKPVLVSVRIEGDAYLITVADHGPGIPASQHEKVFERFVRGEGGIAGAGLGLAIVRRAIARHGGEIGLANRVGGGLDVTLRLPWLMRSADQ